MKKYMVLLFVWCAVFALFVAPIHAQETTPPIEESQAQPAPVPTVQADGDEAPVVIVENSDVAPQWYNWLMAVFVLFLTFTEYTNMRFRGKSLTELAQSIPASALPLLFTFASHLANMTKTPADNNAIEQGAKIFGYTPRKVGNDILWEYKPTTPPNENTRADSPSQKNE